MRRLPLTSKVVHNDCLAADARETMVSPVSTIRTARSTSSMRGAVFCGKQNGDSMYLGKGFSLPPRESPGPIYQPISTLDTTHGISFSSSQRFGPAARSLTPGPNLGLTSTIGKQSESTFDNPPNTIFAKSRRFPSEKARQHNAPIAYQSVTSTNNGRSVGIGGARSVATNKIFISRAHVADCVGHSSPGPIYNIDDSMTSAAIEAGKPPPVFVAHKSNFSSGPSFSFGAKLKGDGGRRAKSAEPGPGNYTPSFSQVEHVPVGVSFPKSRKVSRGALPATVDAPMFNPDESIAVSHVPGVSFGPAPESGDKFPSKQHIGKGFQNNLGAASPGPAYALPPTDKGKSVSFAFKEKVITNRLYPGPDRARFISKALQSESLGAYSPGPKYNIQDDPMWKTAPSVSFGISDRYFVDTNFTEEHRRKFGTAEKPYTCPSEARFVSLAHSRATMAGKASPGPVGNPSIEGCSQFKKPPSISIAPPPRKRPIEDSSVGVPQYTPSFTQIDLDSRVHAIPKAERFVAVKGSGVPGPGHYDVKFYQVENPPKNVSVGIL